jgi:hypothetical protein
MGDKWKRTQKNHIPHSALARAAAVVRSVDVQFALRQAPVTFANLAEVQVQVKLVLFFYGLRIIGGTIDGRTDGETQPAATAPLSEHVMIHASAVGTAAAAVLDAVPAVELAALTPTMARAMRPKIFMLNMVKRGVQDGGWLKERIDQNIRFYRPFNRGNNIKKVFLDTCSPDCI